MSTLVWQDWSCEVRVVVDDGIAHRDGPADAVLVRRVVGGLMADVAAAVDRFRADSELSRLNASAPALMPVGPLTYTLIEAGLRAATLTEGACDPTVGAAVIALGYDADIDTVRARDLAPMLDPRPAPGWTRVRLDHDLRRIGLPAEVRLDLNATGKAWTADEASQRLAARLGTGVLVSIGGDLAVAGGGFWPILVSEIAGGIGQQVVIDRGGVATSSTVARRWGRRVGGVPERHHIVDPRTGASASGAVRTASVWAADCVRANALSTAAIVWGEDAWDRLQHEAARLVMADGRVLTTPSWPAVPVATEQDEVA